MCADSYGLRVRQMTGPEATACNLPWCFNRWIKWDLLITSSICIACPFQNVFLSVGSPQSCVAGQVVVFSIYA